MENESNPDSPAAEQKAFALLDTYTQGLNNGRPLDKADILGRNPELAAAVECLDALALLAAPAADSDIPAVDLEAPTQRGPDAASEAAMLPAPSRASGAGIEFGRYELLQEIGRGGMGVVYKARQKDLDRVVALKMILASNFASDEQIRRFHVESRTAARLHHPNMVQIYEAGQVHGQYYFAMEYVEGLSLAALLREGALPFETAVTFITAIAGGVAHLHAQGIVHRDLKPANVLLQIADCRLQIENQKQPPGVRKSAILNLQSAIPKITDFGLVKCLEEETRMTNTGAIVGTPSYMAPEQASGRPDVGPLCDVYSLGAILYEMLTGRPPFQGETPLDTLVQVLESEATLPSRLRSGIPREMELICLKCLDKTPSQRYPSAQAFVHDLDRFQRGETVDARPRGFGQSFLRWARREPALLAHLAVLVLCFSVSHVYYLMAHQVSLRLHVTVLIVLTIWGGVSVVCQSCLRREWRPDLIRTIWLTTDAVFMTVAFALVDAQTSPVLVCYPLFIAASGLWFRVRLVWLTTVLSMIGYIFLLIDAEVHGVPAGALHHQILCLGALATLGFVVAHQVQRVRALSRYYEHRPCV